jgi:hypothetical protein
MFIKFYSSYFSVKHYSKLELYHLVGFLSDGIGAILLLLFATPIYRLLGVEYVVGYQSVIYGFMLAVGIMHLLGVLKKECSTAMAYATVSSRIMASAIFFALFSAEKLDWMALAVSGYDLLYAFIYIIFFYAI